MGATNAAAMLGNERELLIGRAPSPERPQPDERRAAPLQRSDLPGGEMLTGSPARPVRRETSSRRSALAGGRVMSCHATIVAGHRSSLEDVEVSGPGHQ